MSGHRGQARQARGNVQTTSSGQARDGSLARAAHGVGLGMRHAPSSRSRRQRELGSAERPRRVDRKYECPQLSLLIITSDLETNKIDPRSYLSIPWPGGPWEDSAPPDPDRARRGDATRLAGSAPGLCVFLTRIAVRTRDATRTGGVRWSGILLVPADGLEQRLDAGD